MCRRSLSIGKVSGASVRKFLFYKSYCQCSSSLLEALTGDPWETEGMPAPIWQIGGFCFLMPPWDTHGRDTVDHQNSVAVRIEGFQVQSWAMVCCVNISKVLVYDDSWFWKLRISFLWKSASSIITEVEISSPLWASVCVHTFLSNWENLSDILIAATVEMHIPMQTYAAALRPICP